MNIGILNYGFGNLCSITKALIHLDINFTLINPGDQKLDLCDRFILPGVGSFEYGINKINRDPQLNKILEQIKNGKPILGICLGMQLLFSTSTEGSLNHGLDLIPGNCRPFSEQKDFSGRVPHVGFAPLKYNQPDILFEGIEHTPYMYFIHSYMIPLEQELISSAYSIATATYSGTEFVAYIRKKNVIGMQYHPEKSQRLGLQSIYNFAKLDISGFQ